MSRSASLLGVLIVMPFVLVWQGWAFVVMWGWFVAPVFGLPMLTAWQGVGLMLALSFLKTESGKAADTDEERLEQFAGIVTRAFLNPALLLGIGWLVRVLS